MCDVNKLEVYSDRWNDYFDFVNTDIRRWFTFEDELYIAYGSYNNLPIEDVKQWHRDAVEYFIATDPETYINHKYGDHLLSEDDVEYYIDKEIDEGMLYENNGYWFRA